MKSTKRISKSMLILALAAFFVSTGLTANAHANYNEGKCYKNDSCSKCCKKDNDSKKSLEDKFFMKAHFLKENAEAIGLTDEQVNKIKALKTSVKKDVIRYDAEIEVAKVDIWSNLYDRNIDVGAINTLIDSKYTAKNAKAKRLVAAYAELKGMLTDAQYDQMKKVWQEMHG